MGEPFKYRRTIHGAIWDAVEAGDANGLLTLLRTPEGKHVLFTTQAWGHRAAKGGHTECLRVLDTCGFKLTSSTWTLAARLGHTDCLAFAVSRGYTLEDCALERAVENGHLACVDFLVRHGLPRKPYVHSRGRVNPNILQCWQLMADRGVAIHPWSMMVAVALGDVDFVRWLHHHGVPLWKHAIQHTGKYSPYMYEGFDRSVPWGIETVLIPSEPWRVEDMWKTLRYGAVHGSPITPTVEGVFRTKRQQSRAVLMCFKVMERQCTAPLPLPLVEQILILADLEIRETMLPPRLLMHHH